MACVSTCTFASSHATNSPFIQMRSAVLNAYSLVVWSEVCQDLCRGLLGGRVAAEVLRAQAVVEGLVHRRFYGRGLVLATQSVAQHHRDAAEHRERVGGIRAGDVGRRSMHGLEQAWRAGLADRRAREHADAAGEH